MKNLKAYGLSVAIIWPWPSWLGICWKVHLGPMEGVWHRFSFEEGKPKQRLKLKKVNQTLKNQMKTWLLLALKPYTNRLFESNIGPSPADLLALYPHTWAAYIMGTSTYFNKTNSNQECPTIRVTLWDSDHFYSFFSRFTSLEIQSAFHEFYVWNCPSHKVSKLKCTRIGAVFASVSVVSANRRAWLPRWYFCGCRVRVKLYFSASKMLGKTRYKNNAITKCLLNHNYIHGGIWPNTQKIQLWWSSSFTVHPASIPNTRSNKAWHQRSHRFFLVSIPNSLAAQLPLDLKKASEITPVWACRPRRVVGPNLGWHVGSLHGAPGR